MAITAFRYSTRAVNLADCTKGDPVCSDVTTCAEVPVPVVPGCCPGVTILSILHLTFQSPTCPLLDGFTVRLTYFPTSGNWNTGSPGDINDGGTIPGSSTLVPLTTCPGAFIQMAFGCDIHTSHEDCTCDLWLCSGDVFVPDGDHYRRIVLIPHPVGDRGQSEPCTFDPPFFAFKLTAAFIGALPCVCPDVGAGVFGTMYVTA